MWVLVALGALAVLVILQTDAHVAVPAVDVRAYVGRPYTEAVDAIKTQQPHAVVVAYRARDTDSPDKPFVMAMQAGVHYLGVDKQDRLLGAVPAQYTERNIKHSGILTFA